MIRDMDIYNDTIDLLKATKGHVSRRKIAADTGLGYEWINKLAQGLIEDPGVQKIQMLHNYLVNLKTDQAA